MPALLAFFYWQTKGIGFMGMRALIYVLTIFILITGCNNREKIVMGLSQEDANEILVALWDNHINATKEAHSDRKNTNYTISVPAKQAHEALRILVINQLPPKKSIGLKEVYPPGSAGIIPTKSDEAARLTMALQGEVEALIKALPHVADAHVVLSIENNNAKSASLTVTYRPDLNDEILPVNENELQSLVSSAIGGLSFENIIVVMKALKPIKYINSYESININKLSATPSSNPVSNNLIWPLFVLVILALLTAAYALMRPRIKSWLGAAKS